MNLFKPFFKPLIVLAIVLACAVVLPLAGCSTNPATGANQFTALMSPQQEVQVGAEEHQKLMQTMGDKNVPAAVKAKVEAIGQTIAAHTERPEVQYQFFVLDTPQVNAFALPGGYVYVTRGLMALTNSEAELAAVIAHEIGHITGRHSAARYSQGVLTSLGAAAIAAALDSPAAAQAVGLGGDLYIKSYSRGQESEADQLGIRYLQRAGYDPQAMASFLENLQRNEGLDNMLAGRQAQGTGVDSYFSTHPQTVERIAQARQWAAGGTGADKREEYLRLLDGMIYGDSPHQGFVRGQTFFHPEMDFTFTVPQGFTLDNQPTQVTATNGRGAALIFDAANNPQGLTAATYLQNVWLQGKDVGRIETVEINGKPAATAGLSGQVGGQAAAIRVIAVQWSPQMIFRFQIAMPQSMDAAAVEDLKRATYSLRPMTAEEKRDAQPLRLRTVKAGPGDTAESLGRAMPFDNYSGERFRVLNGLNPGEPVQNGRLYKTIRAQ